MEDIKMDVWKISEFTQKVLDDLSLEFPGETVSIHINTIDKWFKEMEERGIHYVQRASGEKIYDTDDLQIAKFIFTYRKQKFNKDVIYRILPEKCFTRDFSSEHRPNNSNELSEHTLTQIKLEIEKEVERRHQETIQALEERLSQFLLQQQKQVAATIEALPDPETQKVHEKEMKDELTKDLISIQFRVEQKIEEEALDEWNKLPESERKIKNGLFAKKTTNYEKQAAFIRQYKKDHLSEALKFYLE